MSTSSPMPTRPSPPQSPGHCALAGEVHAKTVARVATSAIRTILPSSPTAGSLRPSTRALLRRGSKQNSPTRTTAAIALPPAGTQYFGEKLHRLDTARREYEACRAVLRLLTPTPAPTPTRLAGKIVALAAALSVALVSSAPGILEACGFCPANCPMHNAAPSGEVTAPAHQQGAAKPHCHSGRSRDGADGTRVQRPPCKSTFTMTASPLPPFVLIDRGRTVLDLPDLGEVTQVAGSPSNREERPEVPPPIRG